MKILLFMMFVLPGLAHGHGGEEGSTSIGPGKGVEWYDEHEGFKLSKEAVKRIGIQSEDIGSQTACNLKRAEVVSALGEKVIYVLRDAKYKAYPRDCANVKKGDLVVIHGASFLRVIDMDLQSGEEEEGEHEGEHEEAGSKVDASTKKASGAENEHD